MKKEIGMKRVLALMAVLVALACASDAGAAGILTGKLFYEQVSSTATASVVTFPVDSSGQPRGLDSLSVSNVGANEVWIALDEAATVSKVQIRAGETLHLDGGAVADLATLGMINSAAETSTVDVRATVKR